MGILVRKLFTIIGLAFAEVVSGDPQILKVHHPLPISSTAHQEIIIPWCDAINTASQGELKCQIYPSMQLGGSVPQLIDQLRDGVVDVIWTLPGFSPGRFPKTEVFELPFMIHDAEAASVAVWDYVSKYAVGEYSSMKLLGFHVHGGGVFHTVNRLVRDESDLRQMKIRAPTRPTTRFLGLLGAVPVGMPVPQVPEALTKGVIDGTLLPYEVMPALRVNELTNYHSEPNLGQPKIYTSVFLFAMNEARFLSLSNDLQEIIMANSGPDLSRQMGRTFKNAETKNRALLNSESIHVLDDEIIVKWRQLSEPLADSWMRELGAEGEHLYIQALSLIRYYEELE